MNPTCFSQIIGHDEIKNRLCGMISKKAIGHALLFAGPDGVGKSLFAWALAAKILSEGESETHHAQKIQHGNHPDVHVYRPEGKLSLHSIQSMRQLSEEVYLPPYEASWKVFIIYDAERMLSYSANALLKTFEEPPPRTVIILLSRSQAVLLPTILSRCSTVQFHPLSDDLIQKFLQEKFSLDHQTCMKIVRQSRGSLGRAKKLAEHGDETRQHLLNLLAKVPFSDYRALQAEIQIINERMELIKKNLEEAVKEEREKIYTDRLSSQLQHALDKELEGFTSLALIQEAQAIFETVLSWYRDLHLLLLGGYSSLLMNPDFESELIQAVQRGDFKSLEYVQKAVEEAYLSLQRSTSLSICLETLFLKLDRVV